MNTSFADRERHSSRVSGKSAHVRTRSCVAMHTRITPDPQMTVGCALPEGQPAAAARLRQAERGTRHRGDRTGARRSGLYRGRRPSPVRRAGGSGARALPRRCRAAVPADRLSLGDEPEAIRGSARAAPLYRLLRRDGAGGDRDTCPRNALTGTVTRPIESTRCRTTRNARGAVDVNDELTELSMNGFPRQNL
jgi:hypothetical protein